MRNPFPEWLEWLRDRGRGHAYLYRSIVLLALIEFALAAGGTVQPSRSENQTPNVQTNQNSEHAPNRNANSDNHQSSTAPAPATPTHILGESTDGKCQCIAPEKKEEGTEFWAPLHGYQLKITDTLIAVFTIGLFVATFLLWLSTRALVKGAEITAERQLRAYVFIQEIDLHMDQSATILFKNCGQTPAYDIETWHMMFVAAFPLPFEPVPAAGKSQESEGHMGPGMHINTTANPDRPITQYEWAGVDSGQGAFWLVGGIRYRDAFGETRNTTYCVYRKSSKIGGFTNYHKYNTAT